MDAGEAFRLGLGSVNRAREARAPRARESSHETEDASPRIAHTLAACCRCRQRKTRCDPTLPRCLPCERAGSVCEYYDTAKGKKISRTYVIRLQDKVRNLQLELGRYVDEDGGEHDTEESIRPGGLVRLEENDETPRYLGPSSGIAMTRLVMEEARRYTDSRSIRELVPEVSQRRTPVQSPAANPPEKERKRSFPMRSAIPSDHLPSKVLRDKLIEVFNQKAQYLFPTLHEPSFYQICEDVYAGDKDKYKNFIVRMVLAISMQKLDSQYAGLADSYYLAAMQTVDDVIRPKDLKTLQCLVLIAQYSLMTPTQTPIYYIVGLATRLCQQLGLAEEKTITSGVAQGLVDPLQMDMRRRLSWIVLSMEMGLAHSLGRPNGFATAHDHVDVGFFSTQDDRFITSKGISSTEPAEKKIMAIHFFKMRLLQAEVRRTLYQRKRDQPKNDEHPWFAQMEKKMNDWLEASPAQPAWSRPWFSGKLNTIIVFLFRPSPQIPKPSVRAAHRCYEASAYNIKMHHGQMDNPAIDITWIFLQSLFAVVNTLLWSISYPDVRAQHTKEEVQGLLDLGINVMERCTDRWPGSESASGLYQRLGKATLKAYDGGHYPKDKDSSSSLSANSPASVHPESPFSEHSNLTVPTPGMTFSHQASPNPEPAPLFNFVFNQSPDNTAATQYHQQNSMGPPAPTFRSNSIFNQPSTRGTDRRFSFFPPDVGGPAHPGQQQMAPPPPQQQQHQHQQQPSQNMWNQYQDQNTSPPLHTAPSMGSTGNVQQVQQPQQQQQQHLQTQQNMVQNQQRLDFNSFDEQSYFIQPTYNFGPSQMSNFGFGGAGGPSGGGANGEGMGADFGPSDTTGGWGGPMDRMDSLTYDQQVELMDCLEGDVGTIDDYLGLVPNMTTGYYAPTNIQ